MGIIGFWVRPGRSAFGVMAVPLVARYQAEEKWHVRNGWDPSNLDASVAHIVSKRGAIPTGAQTWQCSDGERFHDRIFTVTALQ